MAYSYSTARVQAAYFGAQQHMIANQDPPSDDWPTYHRDMLRSGYDPAIPIFTSVSLNWKSSTLDGDVYAEPLIVGSNVIVATESNSLYELNGANGQTLWHINLGTPVDGTKLPCGNINPSGITGTPVIDVAGGTIFVVAFLQAPSLHHELFAIDLGTGHINFQLAIDPQNANATVQQQRAALALANGYVYVAYGGLDGDCGLYHGWLAATNTNGLGPVISYQVPTGDAGAIWGGGDGPAVDNSGNLLVATGNSFSTSVFDFGEAVMKLSPASGGTIGLVDWFAPSNWAQLNVQDLDLGSTEPVILSSNYLFQIGKSGIGYLLDATSLGGIGGQLYSSQVCTSGHGAYGGLAYSSPYLIVPCDNGVVALNVTLGSNPPFSVVWRGPNFLAGPPIIAGNAVWTVDVSHGLIYALSLTKGQTIFHDTIGSIPTHFNSVSAGDGQIFVSASRQVLAYLPSNVPLDQISSVVSGGVDSAWVVMPDYTGGASGIQHTSLLKCGGVFVAFVTDVYAATYFYGALTNTQNEILDTNSGYVSQSSSSCGQPSTSVSQPVVAVAGPAANEVVHYYESTSSPLYYNYGTGCITRRDTGACLDHSAATLTSDVFVMEAFNDVAGRTVFVIYGRQYPGTLAGLEYLVNFVLKNNPSAYTASWYVYSWKDATTGFSANSIPDPGDTYTQLAAGP